MKLWIATDKDGKQCSFSSFPIWDEITREYIDELTGDCVCVFSNKDKPLPNQTWEDEPQLVEFYPSTEIKKIVTDAHMAGQSSEGVDASWAEASGYYHGKFVVKKR